MEEEDNDFFYECDEKTLSEVVANEEEPPSKGRPSLLSTQRKRRRPEQPTRTPRPSWQRLRAALGGGGRGRECRPEARLFFRDFACDEDFAFMISLLRGRCQGSQDGCSAEAMVASGPVPLVKLSLNGPFVLRARHTRMLADVLCGSAVRELRLSDGQELDAFDRLASLLRHAHHSSLTTLSILRARFLRRSQMSMLADSLQHNHTLTELQACHSDIDDCMAKSLASALSNNTSLTTLRLAANRIGCGGAAAFAACLTRNQHITSLDLSQNYIGNEGMRALARALVHNTTVGVLVTKNSLLTDTVDPPGWLEAVVRAMALLNQEHRLQLTVTARAITLEGMRFLMEKLATKQCLHVRHLRVPVPIQRLSSSCSLSSSSSFATPEVLARLRAARCSLLKTALDECLACNIDVTITIITIIISEYAAEDLSVCCN